MNQGAGEVKPLKATAGGATSKSQNNRQPMRAVMPCSSVSVLPEAVPLLAALLSVPLDDRYPPLTLTPERQRQRTLETVLTVLRGLAAHQPVLLIMEDLHWVDPSTLELLG